MSLLVVGSVALDSVETPFGKRDDVLGGSATYFSAAASLLTKVSVQDRFRLDDRRIVERGHPPGVDSQRDLHDLRPCVGM